MTSTTLVRVAAVIVAVCTGVADAQTVSPCPRLFTYEARKPSEPDTWYGIVTLLSDTDLTGIWLRLIFDRPSIKLGNWFGQIQRKTPNEYLLKKPGHVLKANVPQTVRIFLKYDLADGGPVPLLTGFRLNAKTVCPEEAATPSPEAELSVLQTSDDLGGGATSLPSPPPPPPPPAAPPNVPVRTSVGACGTVAVLPRPLITNGQKSYAGQFPWHAALYRTKNLDLTYICGASLVSKNHVLTVAHCVTRSRQNGPINPETLLVYVGKFYLRGLSDRGIQDREVDRIIVHPDYNGQTFVNDIAMVKLSTPVDLTDYVRPICLWDVQSNDLKFVVNKLGTVVGWGFDERGRLAEQLTQARMPVVSSETCLYSYPEFFSRFTSDKTFCAGFRNGTSVCNGDSGGGMVFPKPGTNPPTWQLRGLVSVSVNLQLRCDPNHYVVFTDTAKYTNWLKGAMSV